MKTLKTLFALLAVMLAWHGAQAQCATFSYWQPSPGSDSVYFSPLILSADSFLGSATIDFGDGHIEAASNYNGHIYGTTGQFIVCINYTGPSCTSSYCDTIDVSSCSITANMEVSQNTNAGVTTLSVSNVPSGSSYNWHLAAGATAPSTAVANPTVTYPPNGTYSDYVEITSTDGCTRYVGYVVNTLTSCSAGWNKQQYGNNLNVSAAIYHSGATYTWSFGDGQTAVGTNQTHTYASFGTYNVCLKVQTAGCVDSVCQTITTTAPACPSGDSLFNSTVQNNGAVEFRLDITDSIYAGTSITINYGDGMTNNLYYTDVHTYSATGTYVACVNYQNTYCNVTQCDTILVDLCNYSSSINYVTQTGAIYYYLNNANPSWIYQWSFPGGTPSTSTNPYQQVSYTTSGYYNASVTVTIPGCSGTYTANTTVYYSSDSCNAYFTYTALGGTVYFNPHDTTNLTNGDAYFNYGDGTTGTSRVHSYATAGTYNVKYVVENAYCADSTTQAITLSTGAVCTADFSYTIQDKLVYIQPYDSTLANFFYYGDGTGDYNTTHYYSDYGTYTLCNVKSSPGCSDTVCKQITITPGITTIYGDVSKQGIGLACNAQVFLITDSAGYLTAIDTAIVMDSAGVCNGTFHFTLPHGTYYLKAALLSTDPGYADFLPTYFGGDLNWIDASPVVTGATSGPWGINLIAGTNPGGPGFIGGLVSQGAGLGVIHNYENRAVGDPLPNIQINLLTDNDVPVAYTYSDGSGMYAFNNIPLGSYKVYAEAISKTPITETVTLTANNPSVNNVNVEVNTSNALTSINDIAELKVDAVYPNPVKDVAIVRFTAKQNAEAKVQVTDVRGVIVYSSTTDINTGSNELKIDLANHAAGVYVVTITNRDNNKTIRLLKAN